MKVIGSRQVDAPTVRRAQRRADGAGQTFHVDAEPAPRASAAGPVGPLTAVDSLLALQAVPDSTEGRRRSVRRAGDLLDFLDAIKLGLLDGEVPRGKLEGLLRVVQTQRDDVPDPALSAVLDEIEVRARVELAKFGIVPVG